MNKESKLEKKQLEKISGGQGTPFIHRTVSFKLQLKDEIEKDVMGIVGECGERGLKTEHFENLASYLRSELPEAVGPPVDIEVVFGPSTISPSGQHLGVYVNQVGQSFEA